ncbi:MAG: hypothetical protein AB7G39_12790 [Alphaproteobacteria bacterium]
MTGQHLWIALLLPLALAACNPPGPTPAEPAPSAATLASAQMGVPQPGTDGPADWLGRWNGPEGTFLSLAPGAASDEMRMTLKDNLDSQDTYVATVSADRLRFTRDGIVETIRHGTGTETGFKWLADKQDCLIVVPGREGYCRD